LVVARLKVIEEAARGGPRSLVVEPDFGALVFEEDQIVVGESVAVVADIDTRAEASGGGPAMVDVYPLLPPSWPRGGGDT
jgi:hypothetical protein